MVVLAVPLLVGQLGQVVLSFADSAMVGNYGVADLAAASFCVNLFNLPLIFLMGYSYGLLPARACFSRRRGNAERGCGRGA